METLAIIATICATLITVIWFIRDVRKENSKILKKIEEGQREGFAKQAEASREIAKILERIEQGTETTARILERVAQSAETTAKILERVEKG